MSHRISLPIIPAALCSGALLLFGHAPGAAAAPAPARSEAAPPSARAVREQEAADFCREISRAAAAESAPLYWPRLFSRFGLLRGSPIEADSVGAARRDLTWNLQAGIDVSPIRMRTGALLEARARAECSRYAAELALRALTEEGEIDVSPALVERLRVLRLRLPEAEQRLAQSAERLRAARVSAPVHAATRRRVEQLRRAIAEAELALASAAEPAQPRLTSESVQPPSSVFEALRESEAEVQEVEGELRAIDSIAVSLRAGYDEVFGVTQNIPLFAFVNVELSPAWPWQAADNAASQEAHRRRIERRIEEARAVLSAGEQRLHRQLAVLDRRLSELADARAAVQANQQELAEVGTSAALDFLEELWFESVGLEAEQAHAQALRGLLLQRRQQLRGARPR